jgi:hypothetical protein
VGTCNFFFDFRVLPLVHHEVILGMDWLSTFSPMQVHWQEKWVAIPYQGAVVVLQGEDFELPNHLLLQLCAMDEPVTENAAQSPTPPKVQSIIDSFANLFTEPFGRPASHSCNHTIPLLPYAQPVFTRPYCYLPALKDKVE